MTGPNEEQAGELQRSLEALCQGETELSIEQPKLAPGVLGLLAYAREGLTEELLSRGVVEVLLLPRTRADEAQRSVELVLAGLDRHVRRAGGVWALASLRDRNTARKLCTGSAENQRSADGWHRALMSVCDCWEELAGESRRCALEGVVFHRLGAGRADRAEEALTDFRFHLHRFQAAGGAGITLVLEELDEVFRAQSSREPSEALKTWRRFFGVHAHRIRHDSVDRPADMFLGAALAYADESLITRKAEEWLGSNGPEGAWLRKVCRPKRVEEDGCLLTLEGHSKDVNMVAVYQGGRRAVSVGEDEALKVWSLVTGECLRTVKAHGRQLEAVAVSPDGRTAVTGSWDKRLKVWDLSSGRLLRTLVGHTDWIRSVVVHPDCRRMVSAGDDKTWRSWDLATGSCLREVVAHEDWIRSVTILPDGRRVATAGDDGKIELWDLESGQSRYTLDGHEDSVRSLAAHPDGRRLMSASNDGTIKIWDLTRGSVVRTLRGHEKEVCCVVIEPRGLLAVSAGSDQTLKVWALDSGRCLRTLTGHTACVNHLAVTSAGEVLSCSDDHTVKLWSLKGEELHRELPRHPRGINDLTSTGSGTRVVTCGDDGYLRLWNLERGELEDKMGGGIDRICALTGHPDGRRVIYGDKEKKIQVWDLDAKEHLLTLEGHEDWVRSLVVHHDGKHLVSGSDDRSVRVWDLETGDCLHQLTGHADWVRAVDVLPPGRAVSAADDQTLRVWDLQQARCVDVLEGHEDWVLAVALEPERRLAISGSRDKTIGVWDLQTSERLARLEVHSDRVTCVSVHRNGHLFASGSRDGTVKVWDLERHECLATWRGGSPVRCCLLESERVVAGTADGELLVLELMPPGPTRLGSEVCPTGRRAVIVAAWHPTRSWVASVRDGDEVVVAEWHSVAAYLEEIARFPLESGSAINSLAWSTDGRAIRCRGEKGHEVHLSLEGSNDEEKRRTWVASSPLSPDGRWHLERRGDHVVAALVRGENGDRDD